MIVMMTVIIVFLSYVWPEDRHNHCDGDDLYDDHHCEFELGGQGRGSNGQRHQVYKQKPSFSSLSCLIRTFMDGSTHHVLLFIKILAVQDKTNLIITLLIALLIKFNDPAWSPGPGLQNHHHICCKRLQQPCLVARVASRRLGAGKVAVLGALGDDQEAGQYRWGESGGAFTILFVIHHWL